MLGEAPSIDAFHSGRPVLAGSLDSRSEDRWPAFAGAVADGGRRAVFAFPLSYRSEQVGTITFYSRRAVELNDSQLALIAGLLDPAARALADHVDGHRDGDTAGAGRTFLRAEVYQASGMVMCSSAVRPRRPCPPCGPTPSPATCRSTRWPARSSPARCGSRPTAGDSGRRELPFAIPRAARQ